MTAARACALVVAAVLAAYATAFGGAFQFDDFRVIVNNPAVHDGAAWWASMPGIRPLLKATYTLSWIAGNGGTVAFHAFNVAVHATSACLVLLLVRHWTDGSVAMLPSGTPVAASPLGVPIAVALIFALHPAQTETVTYISGRSSALMAMFYLGCVLAWERGRAAPSAWRWSALSLGLFAAALAVKETAWTLPFALLLIEFTRNGRHGREAWNATRAHFVVLGVAVVAILALPTYRRMLAAAVALRDPLDNLGAQVSGIAYLLANPLVTLHLNIDPVVPRFTGVTWLLVAAALLLLLWVGIAGVRRGFVTGFGLLWFFLHLAPTNSLIARDDIANDRQLVLALIGIALVYASIVHLRLPRQGFVAVTAALAIVLGTTTALRNLDYRSELALWQASLAADPRNPRAWNNLGMAWRTAGRADEARVAFQRALELDPEHPQALTNLLDLEAASRAAPPAGGRSGRERSETHEERGESAPNR